MAMCQISLCPRFKLPCSFAVYPYTLHSMNEINVENMFPKLGENIYYWGFPKIRVLAIAHAWAMTKILDEKHQHPYPKFYCCVPNNKTLIRQWWTIFCILQVWHSLNSFVMMWTKSSEITSFCDKSANFLYISFINHVTLMKKIHMKCCPAKLSFCCCLVNVQVCISHWFYSGFSGWPLTSSNNLHPMSDIQMKKYYDLCVLKWFWSDLSFS